jgi:predicted kinase
MDDSLTPFSEIDLSERGWYRFSRDIMTMVSAIPNLSRARLHKSLDEMLQAGADQQPWFNEYKQRQKIVLTVGIPGSGKSTFAERLQEQSGWVRVNQDELGTRRAVEVRMEAALKQGLSVIVDRTNFDYQQRNNWVKMAAQYRINTIFCVLFDIDAAVCKSRISVRKNHPTIPEGDSGHVIVDKFTTMLVPPRRGEGFCEIFTVRTDDDIARVMQLLTSLAPKL